MKINEGLVDRIARIIIGSLSLVIGKFWLITTLQVISMVFGAVLVLTGLVGFCGIYAFLKVNSCSKHQKPLKSYQTLLLVFLFGLTTTIASMASIKITQNKFLEDFNQMNGFYKQTLFLTGQGKRDEARANYDQWAIEFQKFSQKYSSYKPYVLKKDSQFDSDLDKVSSIISDTKSGVYEGDLPSTHVKLEAVRPVFQEMFKRNGFTMLAIALTDFHDSMEKLIAAADAKKPADIISNYPESSGILAQVEAELNDAGIKAIRQNLEDLLSLAKDNKADDLSKKAAELKSSFVKVYLIKG